MNQKWIFYCISAKNKIEPLFLRVCATEEFLFKFLIKLLLFKMHKIIGLLEVVIVFIKEIFTQKRKSSSLAPSQ